MPLTFVRHLEGRGIFIGKPERAVQEHSQRVVPLTLLAQAAVTFGLMLVTGLFFGRTAAISVLLGGLAALLPNSFLAARMLKPDRDARRMLQRAWIGEIGKWILTIAIFIVIFAAVRPLAPAAVFGGFIAAQLVILGALYVDGRAGMKRDSHKS